MRIFLFMACLLAAAPVAAKDYYGAIAYSFGNGAWGNSWNYSSKSAAQGRALAECKAKGGKRCEIGVWAHNSCGAFAVMVGANRMANTGWSAGYNTHADAKARALKECKKRSHGQACKVVASTCNFGK